MRVVTSGARSGWRVGGGWAIVVIDLGRGRGLGRNEGVGREGEGEGEGEGFGVGGCRCERVREGGLMFGFLVMITWSVFSNGVQVTKMPRP